MEEVYEVGLRQDLSLFWAVTRVTVIFTPVTAQEKRKQKESEQDKKPNQLYSVGEE